ncbi:hypothetical protein Ciccas_011746 [Cichlidogyrus casuarinus]|uniref:Uncharacterized protein n=1 Tax=Cichlidogyrus casuarinus TaxID=1844966 RepID=A0ABD2PQD4_9PLAT
MQGGMATEDLMDGFPVLLMVHGTILAPGLFDLWLDSSRGPCMVQRVLVNGMSQRPVGESLFASTAFVKKTSEETVSESMETNCPRTQNRVVVSFKQTSNDFRCCVATVLLLVRPLHSSSCPSTNGESSKL